MSNNLPIQDQQTYQDALKYIKDVKEVAQNLPNYSRAEPNTTQRNDNQDKEEVLQFKLLRKVRRERKCLKAPKGCGIEQEWADRIIEKFVLLRDV